MIGALPGLFSYLFLIVLLSLLHARLMCLYFTTDALLLATFSFKTCLLIHVHHMYFADDLSNLMKVKTCPLYIFIYINDSMSVCCSAT